MKRAGHVAFCRLRPVLALARPVSQRAAIGSHDCGASTPDPNQLAVRVWVSYFGCRARKQRTDVAGEWPGTNSGVCRAHRSKRPAPAASGHPGGNGVRPSSSSASPWLLFAADSHRFARPSAGASNQKQLPVRARDQLLLFAPCAEQRRCGRGAGRVDLGSGRPHRLKRPAPGASDPPSGGGVGP